MLLEQDHSYVHAACHVQHPASVHHTDTEAKQSVCVTMECNAQLDFITGDEREAWKQTLCAAMADGLLLGHGKKLARQGLRALCGGHSSYRDAKISYRLRLQLQVRIAHVSPDTAAGWSDQHHWHRVQGKQI